MENLITIQFTTSEMETLLSNLDGLIYSLGFDQDEELVKLNDILQDAFIEFQRNDQAL